MKTSQREKCFWRGAFRLIVLCVALAFASDCRRKPRTERPVDFIPSGADVIALLDYGSFARNDVLARIFDVSQLKQILLGIGLSPENISSVAGFAEIEPAFFLAPGRENPDQRPGEFGVVIQGKVALHSVVRALSERGWLRQKYKGRTFWVAPQEGLAVAALRSNMLVAGTPAAVHEVLDLVQGRTMPATKPGSGSDSGAILRQLGTRGQINIAISFSQEMRMAAAELAKSAGIFGGMVGGNMVAGVLEVLGAGRGVGLSFGSSKGGIASRVVFVARDAASAKILAGLVGVAKIVVPRMGDFAAPGAEELVRGINVWSEGDLVLIDFKIPESLLTGSMRNAQEVHRGEGAGL